MALVDVHTRNGDIVKLWIKGETDEVAAEMAAAIASANGVVGGNTPDHTHAIVMKSEICWFEVKPGERE